MSLFKAQFQMSIKLVLLVTTNTSEMVIDIKKLLALLVLNEMPKALQLPLAFSVLLTLPPVKPPVIPFLFL